MLKTQSSGESHTAQEEKSVIVTFARLASAQGGTAQPTSVGDQEQEEVTVISRP